LPFGAFTVAARLVDFFIRGFLLPAG
jgi:hypothetical protein